MIYTPMTRKALQIAFQAHEGQLDESGIPYIFHPYHVAEQMKDEWTTCIALLHDVLEDTSMTEEQLAGHFPEKMLESLRLLTHDRNVPYMEYIRNIKADRAAAAVKLADIAHNMDESRLSGIGISEERLTYWRSKYREAKKILLET